MVLPEPRSQRRLARRTDDALAVLVLPEAHRQRPNGFVTELHFLAVAPRRASRVGYKRGCVVDRRAASTGGSHGLLISEARARAHRVREGPGRCIRVGYVDAIVHQRCRVGDGV